MFRSLYDNDVPSGIVEMVRLIPKMLATQVTIPKEMLERGPNPAHLITGAARDQLFHGIRIWMQARMPTRDIGTIRNPLNWREAFRERWLPAWWLRRHPVRYRTIDLFEYHRDIVWPDDRDVVMLTQWQTPGNLDAKPEWLETQEYGG